MPPPRDVVQKPGTTLREIVLSPAVRSRLEAEGADVIASTPEEFAKVLKREMNTWVAIVKTSGAKVE